MGKLLTSLSQRQKIAIGAVALVLLGSIVWMVRWKREKDFRPLFSNLSSEDAGAIVAKLKEGGVEYRLPESGGSVLVPSAKIAELRLNMAAAGIPKSGRIGFELFDKTNFGITDFTEHVNYRRALEGELERSVMALAEVEQARVHLTFSKDSVFLDSQQPAKASVLIKLRPEAKLSPKNVQAINHLVASAVEGLSPDAVSVLDMKGNLLGKPKDEAATAAEMNDVSLEYRQRIESQILAKVNAAMTALMGPGRFHAGVSVECDFTTGDQSEEAFDPARSVMLTSQRIEDATSSTSTAGVPGTASTLPRPSSRPASGSGNGVSRVTESITYQPTRTVKRTHLPSGSIKKISLAVMIDQDLTWEKNQTGYKRVLTPPTPEKLKVIKDQVAGVAGIDPQRGDVVSVESLPFDSTLRKPAPVDPQAPKAAPGAAPGQQQQQQQKFTWPPQLTKQQMIIAGSVAGALLLLLVGAVFFFKKKRKKKVKLATQMSAPELASGGASAVGGAEGLPAGAGAAAALAAGDVSLEQRIEAQVAQRNAAQIEAEERALAALKAPIITKTAEVLAKHLRDTIKKQPDVTANVVRSWIREEDGQG